MNREDVAMDVTVQNVEILRGRLEKTERALAGMLFAFDDGVGQEWSADVLDFARKLVKAKEFIDSQQGEQATAAENAQVHPEQAEGDIKKLIVLLRHGDAMPGEQDLAADHLERLLKAEQAEGAQGERNGWGTLPIVRVPWNVFDRAVMWVEDRRRYGDDGTIVDDWKALKAIQRAALAQPSPAPELERPEVVARFRAILGGVKGLAWEYMDRFQVEPTKHGEIVQLMTVAQHQRQVDTLSEWYANALSDLHAITAERDSAQARVAELEKQEPLAWVDADWIAQVSDPRGAGCTVRRAYGSAGADLSPIYAAPVAQAGRVPDSAASAKALVEIEAKKYSLNAAGMFNSGAPGHGQTIAVQELLAGFDDDEAEGHWEAIMAYSDLRASNALFHAAELLDAAPAQGGE